MKSTFFSVVLFSYLEKIFSFFSVWLTVCLFVCFSSSSIVGNISRFFLSVAILSFFFFHIELNGPRISFIQNFKNTKHRHSMGLSYLIFFLSFSFFLLHYCCFFSFLFCFLWVNFFSIYNVCKKKHQEFSEKNDENSQKKEHHVMCG